jgi:hypothetical protein
LNIFTFFLCVFFVLFVTFEMYLCRIYIFTIYVLLSSFIINGYRLSLPIPPNPPRPPSRHLCSSSTALKSLACLSSVPLVQKALLLHFNGTDASQRVKKSSESLYEKSLLKWNEASVILFPILLSYYSYISDASPVIFSKVLQYCHPVNFVLFGTLSMSLGITLLKHSLVLGSSVGFMKMMYDSYYYPSNFVPAIALNDSYAVVTG